MRDDDGLRGLLLLAATALVAALFAAWATAGDIGWTQYTPLGEDDDAVGEAVEQITILADEDGWEALGGLVALVLAAAAALVACALRLPHGRWVLATAALLVAAAVTVLAAGFGPEPLRAGIRADGLEPGPYRRETGWGAYLALVGLGLGAIALALTRWRERPPGAAVLAGAASLLALSPFLPWRLGDDLVVRAARPGTSLVLLVVAALCVHVARRPSRLDTPLLLGALAGACLVCDVGFRDGEIWGPYAALAGAGLAAIALLARRLGAHGPALAAVAAAVLLAIVPFLPWGSGGAYFSRTAGETPDGWQPGFTTAFEVADHALLPLLWTAAAGVLLFALLQPHRWVLVALAVPASIACTATATRCGDPFYAGAAGLRVATAGCALALVALLALAAQPRDVR